MLERDITACFDEIDHTALLGRVRDRIEDRRVLALVKAFLKSGVLSEDGVMVGTKTGTPQGGTLSPLLANIALSVLDVHFAEAWKSWGSDSSRCRRHERGLATYRLVRYADDFVVMVSGTHAHAETLRDDVAGILAPMGLRLSEEKTTIVHIDEGFDFLGFRIQRQIKQGSNKLVVYTRPSRKAFASIRATVKTITRQGTHQPLANLLRQLNPALRGWTTYFRHGVSKATFSYLNHYTWGRVIGWIRRKHPRANWKLLRRRYFHHGWRLGHDGVDLFDTGTVTVTRYRYRGTKIPTPWDEWTTTTVR